MNVAFCLYLFGLLLLAAAVAPAAEALDPARVAQIVPMLPEQPVGVGRPLSDRAAWEKLGAEPELQKVVARATELLTSPLPEQPDDLFLDYSRTGNRTRWQKVCGQRRGRLAPLVIAECVENKGRFLPPLEQLIDALCAERTWVMPAHDGKLTNFNGTAVDIDLASSALGWELATADWLLGDKLSPACRARLRENVAARVTKPYRDMFSGARAVNWWMMTTNNWNAVCLAGVTGAALAEVSDRRERAEYAAAAEKYSRNFLRGFTPDGYCSEGLGYWDYGFGNFVLLAETVRQATGGGVDLLLLPEVKAPAMFGANIQIIGGVAPAFADCGVGARPDASTVWFVNRRLQLGLKDYDELSLAARLGGLSNAMLLSFPNGASETPAATTAAQVGLRTWFRDAGILICRPAPGTDALGVALKGGHNNEHHNHNDVGSYTVVSGTRAVLLDPGAEVYTARTFSSHRYDSKLLNSFGHPVPLVAGQLQRTGAEARAVVLKTDFTDAADTLQLDLKAAYAVPDLKVLERTFVYSRGGRGQLTVTDKVELASAQTFETALIARSNWRSPEPGKVLVYDGDQALEVTIKASAEYDLKADKIEEDSAVKPTRLAVAFKQPVTAASVEFAIRPIDLGVSAGGGLLKNGGFEYESFAWEIPADGISSVSDEKASEGKYSLKIADQATDKGSNVSSMPLPAKPDTSYVLSGQVLPASGKGIGMYVKYYDAQGEQLNATDGKGNIAPVGSLDQEPGGWQPFAYKFRTPPGTVRMVIWIHSYNAGKVEAYLDDMKVAEE